MFLYDSHNKNTPVLLCHCWTHKTKTPSSIRCQLPYRSITYRLLQARGQNLRVRWAPETFWMFRIYCTFRDSNHDSEVHSAVSNTSYWKHALLHARTNVAYALDQHATDQSVSAEQCCSASVNFDLTQHYTVSSQLNASCTLVRALQRP